MTIDVKDRPTGAEEVVWDLTDMYAGVDDPAIETDINYTNERAEAFATQYRDKLTTLDEEELYGAIQEIESIYEVVCPAVEKLDTFWADHKRGIGWPKAAASNSAGVR